MYTFRKTAQCVHHAVPDTVCLLAGGGDDELQRSRVTTRALMFTSAALCSEAGLLVSLFWL